MAPSSPTIAETMQRAGEALRAASIPNDLLDAQTLLAHALGRDRTYLIVNFNQKLTAEQVSTHRQLIARRAAGEPLQYITGHQEFFGLDFEVTPDVLIPRPETELIIEEALRIAEEDELRHPVILDIGTGSGCVALAIARELPEARVIAADISPAALRVAKRNSVRHNLAVSLVGSDLLGAFAETPFADLILSNPPYVAESEMAALQREVREWEPRIALTGAADGLGFYRRLLADAPARLKSGGHLICEMGHTQSEAISAIVDRRQWAAPRLIEDLQGIPRTIVLRKH
ncbi:MAG: peptide chain release factor N(5)-glutamine methyltransferase [Blastocatellia bacterium]